MLNRMSPVHILITHTFNFRFNIIFSFKQSFRKYSVVILR